MSPRIAICPGSFDPLTHGHIAIIRRGLKLFDHIIVAASVNPKKTYLFDTEERLALIRAVFDNEPAVEVVALEGLLAAYASERGAVAILRGLRAPSDFEYELQMAQMNRHLHDNLDTVFLASEAAGSYVSSSLVKEVARLGGRVDDFLHPVVAAALARRLGTGP
jgi:pantetheine-phosphate adenylyltransferase